MQLTVSVQLNTRLSCHAQQQWLQQLTPDGLQPVPCTKLCTKNAVLSELLQTAIACAKPRKTKSADDSFEVVVRRCLADPFALATSTSAAETQQQRVGEADPLPPVKTDGQSSDREDGHR